ncbi:MarR family winged helix-turn-helix transcriptional regulator [Arthrobacter castelli]|uniref:MarR family winged helix-turn-helix transcriptional regulator n=1 Tax=Arthrobacter castelli TaxID=271431 RepID=UPI00040C65C4|nr:MarR family transcriptional regulator [Arthrobacter castelli]
MSSTDSVPAAEQETAPADDDLLLERQLCFALSAASRSVIAAYRPVLAPMGITHPQYLVMLALWERSPRSVKDISAAVMLENATISPLLKRLEAAELVTRHRQPGNQRSMNIELTDKGKELREEARQVPSIMAERLGLEMEDAVRLNTMMQRLIAAAHRPAEGDAGANDAAADDSATSE